MKYNKGLWLDSTEVNQPQGTWRDLRNGIFNKLKGIITNEGGFRQFDKNFVTGSKTVGYCSIDDDIVIFSVNILGVSDTIGIVDANGNYRSLITTTRFNFNISYPVSAKYVKNFKNERIIIFWDEINTPKIINIDDIPALTSTLNEIELFPSFQTPITSTTTLQIQEGGKLKSGTYFVTIKYVAESGFETNWTSIGQPYYVSNSGTRNGSYQTLGSDSDKVSSNLIKLELNNLDYVEYSKIKIGLMYVINGIVFFEENQEVSISAATKTVYITKNGEGKETSFEDLLTPPIIYTSVKDIEVLNDEVLAAGVSEDEEINYQQWANMIEINYVPILVTHNTDEQKNTEGASKGFKSGEVYAFYCSLLLKNGKESKLFHIPGRPAVSTEATDALTAEASGEGLPAGTVKYQVEDTSNNGSALTNMGFWQNVNETYPNTDDYDSSSLTNPSTASAGLDLKGEKVRHHRFPTLRKLESTHYSGNTSFGVNVLARLEIDVSNIVIPASIEDEVLGVKIYYAKRDIDNSTVLSQSLFQYASEGTSTGGDVLAGIGNFSLDVVERLKPHPGFMRYYGFDLLFNKPEVNPLYFTNQIELQTKIAGTAAFTHGASNGVYVNSTTQTRVGLQYLNAGAASSTVNTKKVAMVGGSYLRTIKDYKYIPNDTVAGEIYNEGGDEFIHIEYNDTGAFSIEATAIGATNVIGSSVVDSHTYITEINQLILDIYPNFDRQKDVVSVVKRSNANEYLDVSAGANTYQWTNLSNGDININLHSLTRQSFVNAGTKATLGGVIPTNPARQETGVNTDPINLTLGRGDGAYINILYFCESVSNLNFRREGIEIKSKFFPYTKDINEIFDKSFLYDSIPLYYNRDFNELNWRHRGKIFNNEDTSTTNHPYRILRSNKIGREEDKIVVTFQNNNYYETSKERGFIVALDRLNENLVIRHEDGAYITRPKQKLITAEGGEATLGSNDLFEIEPRELLTTENGYIRSRGRFDSFLTKNGLIVINRELGKIFLINNQVNEITNDGVRGFFDDEFSFLEDTEVKINYTSTSSVLQTYDASNHVEILIDVSAYATTFYFYAVKPLKFNIGEYVWLDTQLTFARITKVYTTISASTKYIVLQTDYVDASPSNTGFTHYRKIQSPYHFDGLLIGYDSKENRLFLTKKNSDYLTVTEQKRFIGKYYKATSFTDDLNVGDIVQYEDVYKTWNGASLVDITTSDQSFTISYDFDSKLWEGFHDFIPDMYLYRNSKMLSLYSEFVLTVGAQHIYVHNQLDNIGKYYDQAVIKDFIFKAIHNQADELSKKFYSLNWKVDFYNTSGVLQTTETFDSITCSNSYETLGEVTLAVFVDLSSKGNVRNVKGTWNFNKLKNSSNKLLSDKYLSTIFKYSDQNLLYLYDIDAQFRLIDKQ